MTMRPLRIPGAFVIEASRSVDERGVFAELYQTRELARCGWSGSFVRTALSHNHQRATLRGLHYQRPPHADAKLVTCVAGAVFDVIADVRSGSPTFGVWEAVELAADNDVSVFVPEGVAHGFETLTPGATVLYHLGAYFDRDAGVGVRWDDPALAIHWPLPPAVISAQDRAWAALQA